MKKFFLALCAIIMGIAANAEEYYLIGNFNGWTLSDENAHFTQAEDGTYVLDYNGNLTTGFKINNGSWNTGVNYGTNGSNLVVGETYSMKYNGQDIAVASSIANPHCVLDVNNWTLTITTTSGPVESVISYAIHGEVFTGSWETHNMTEAEDGTWTLTATLQAGAFGIKKLENGSQIAWYSSASGTKVKVNEAMSVKENGSDWSSTLEGEYTFVFNPTKMTLTIQGETPVDPDPVDPVYSYGIHGSVFTGSWETHNMTAAEDGTWTLTETLVAGEFGIKKLNAEGKQVEWISAADGLTEAVVNIAMGASTSGSNWSSTLEGEYTFVFDPTAMTLTINGKETPVDPDPVDPELPAHVYILGNLAEGSWTTSAAPELTYNESSKKFTIDNIQIVASSEGAATGYFTFVTTLGADWDAVNAGDRYGAPAEDAELSVPSTTGVTVYKADVNASAAKSWKVEVGYYNIELDLTAMTINITKSDSSAADIELGNEVAPVYFNLQGVEVAEPAAGLYIEVRGNQVRKVMIK